MTIEMILQDYLAQPKLELGDRSLYVGASDAAQYPRKVVLSKTKAVPRDLQTLIRFERGNMVERIVRTPRTMLGSPMRSRWKSLSRL